MSDTQTKVPVVDPSGCNPARLAGAACYLCDKRFPRPRTFYGNFPDGAPALVCDDHDVADLNGGQR